MSNKGSFKKGNNAWNKGLRGVNGESGTKFKPGNKPHNSLPIGSTRINKDGWLEVKVAEPKKWESVHIQTWEIVHGKVKKGHIVCFIDGNRLNRKIKNLELLSRAELMKRNTIRRYPQELVDAIFLIKKLERKLNELENDS